ncbi:MAG: hypothetical protein Q8R12_02175 [bacterium]|nr:hypothetical protein [bacterium]
MKPEFYISATPSGDEKTAVLAANHSYKLYLIGSNLPVSVSPGVGVDSFAVCCDKGEQGVIAVRVKKTTFHAKFVEHQDFSYILPVRRSAGGIRVDLELPWVPSQDRLGQVYEDRLEVKIGEDIFTTAVAFSGKPGYRYVSDSNLFCRYLMEEAEASAEKMEEAATAHVEEVNARAKLPLWEDMHKNAAAREERLQDEIDGLEQMRKDKEKGYRRQYAATLNLLRAVEGRWWPGWLHRPSVKKALREFKNLP